MQWFGLKYNYFKATFPIWQHWRELTRTKDIRNFSRITINTVLDVVVAESEAANGLAQVVDWLAYKFGG